MDQTLSARSKEAEVLTSISHQASITQRELSRKTGISLGLVNLILKRFIKTGYVQVTRLNKRKVEYLLTPQGFLETARRTYTYATTTIRNYNALQARITFLVQELCDGGYAYFSIHGDGEMRQLVEQVFRQSLTERSVTLGHEHREDPTAVVLNVTSEPFVGGSDGCVVHVLERVELSQ